jgi:hypothetical protein
MASSPQAYQSPEGQGLSIRERHDEERQGESQEAEKTVVEQETIVCRLEDPLEE